MTTDATASLPERLADAEGELPEEIMKAIDAFEISTCGEATAIGHWEGRAEARYALTATILARLTAAESARDAAEAERTRLVNEVQDYAMRALKAESAREAAERLADQRLDLMWGSLNPKERRWARMGFHEKHAALATERDDALARAETAEKALEATKGALPYISAQLRHAYGHLVNGRATDLQRFADGLLAPQIQRLEALAHPATTEET